MEIENALRVDLDIARLVAPHAGDKDQIATAPLNKGALSGFFAIPLVDPAANSNIPVAIHRTTSYS
jgi:hypothetical protein